ncbi:MAG: oxygenase MpaB family protein [Aquihabitans sp.]
MGFDHSRVVERVDGVPTGAIDPDGARVRFAHSLAFFLAVAIGPVDTAERAARAVRAMHHTIKGTRPDGIAYDADDQHFLRWNYATVVWGIATAHERYHPKPIPDIDRYYREFVRVGEALGGTELPASKRAVAEYLASEAPVMGLTLPGVAAGYPAIRDRAKPLERSLIKFVDWAKTDMLPRWAQDMYSFVPPSAPITLLRRAQLRATFDVLDGAAGPLKEVRESIDRAAQTPERIGS